MAVIWLGSPHLPHIAGKREREIRAYRGLPDKMLNYYGELSGIDRAVGTLRKELRRLKIERETLLWFNSDNGAQGLGSTGGLRGKKGSIWEGGLRTPAILEWPGHITPRTVYRACSTVDLMPTVLEVAGVEAPDVPLDGESLVNLFGFEGDEPPRRQPLGFWSFPAKGRPVRSHDILVNLMKRNQGESLDDIEPGDQPPPKLTPAMLGHAAWLDGRYKLHRIAKEGELALRLYHLGHDPREQRDLAEAQPQRVATMRAALEGWMESVRASSQGADY